MKRKHIFPVTSVLCTMLLLLLGLLMPRFAAMAFDDQLEKDLIKREDTNPSLSLTRETDFFQTLDLFQNDHSQVELSEGYNMTADDVKAASMEILLSLGDSSRVLPAPEVTPLLFTSRYTPSTSGVFWRCIWKEEGPEESANSYEVLWMDDQTGQAVAFMGQVGWASLSAPNSSFPKAVMVLAEFCRLNYPVDSVKLTPLESAEGASEIYSVNLLRNNGELVESFSIPLRLRENWIYFNL